ncbi:MAG: ferritin family protein [Archaeoglobaceae archaeon]
MFEFSDRRLFNEIYKIETSAKALYEQIVKEFGKTLGEKSKILEKIAREEEVHIRLVEKFVDKTLRII